MTQFIVVSLVLLWGVVILNVLLTLALIRRVNSGTEAGGGLSAGQQAPDFSAMTLHGETVTLATYAHQAVAFVFISPHCGPCRQALPTYESLWPLARQAGVELVLVSVVDEVQTRAFVDETKLQIPILVAPRENNSFTNDYKVTGTPFYTLIDAEGKIQAAGYPNPEFRTWKALVESWERNNSRTAVRPPSQRRAIT